MKSYLLAITLLVALAGCSSAGPDHNPEVEPGVYRFDFETGSQGWEAIFVGIPVDKEKGDNLAERVETESTHRSLPPEVEGGQALFIRGYTGSPGMGLHFKRQVEGLEPEATYRVHFDVGFASNIPLGCGGYGGYPGDDSVTALVASTEPTRQLKEGRYVNTYVFSSAFLEEVGLAHQSKWPYLGTVGIDGISCEEAQERGYPYRLKRLESEPEYWTVTPDEAGRAWLLVGTVTDASMEVGFYYDEITVRFEEQE